MYGIAIVDPANGYKKLMVEKTSGSGELDRKFYDADALEFQLQYNQLYLTDAGGYNAVDMFHAPQQCNRRQRNAVWICSKHGTQPAYQGRSKH